MEDINLPFKPGDLAEARSFSIGFRGAWFRCKIKEISKRKGVIGHISEYYDFPGEKLKWSRLYQVPLYVSKKDKEKRREMVLRPRYPTVFKAKEMPDVSDISEVTVIVNDAWKVGDLVDWWFADCFWSGTIVELFGDDSAKLVLIPPPLGEGSTYNILLKDVRPSLDWSLEHGWTIPTQDGPPCARIVKPVSDGMIDQGNRVPNEAKEMPESNMNNLEDTINLESTVPNKVNEPPESNMNTVEDMINLESTVPNEAKETLESNMNNLEGMMDLESTVPNEAEDTLESNTNNLEGMIDLVNTIPNEVKEMLECNKTTEDERSDTQKTESANTDSRNPTKNKTPSLSSTCSDTIEAAVLELEGCLNKVKRLKAILQHDLASSDDAPKDQWEYVDLHGTSSTSK